MTPAQRSVSVKKAVYNGKISPVFLPSISAPDLFILAVQEKLIVQPG
ncbi:hypothetical protein CSC12_5490 [Klebsiella michiganensis]|nr:hypothetical protein CSC12_5490 [Klebsiella michiganensis]